MSKKSIQKEVVNEVNARLNDDLEASLVYRKGGGNTIYTGAQKYALRNFGQQFFKLGLESSKMKFKIYHVSLNYNFINI